MPSPFPGMDPYIEQPVVWSDFHGDLAGEIRAMLNRAVQPRYYARLTPYFTYETMDVGLSYVGKRYGGRPDVGVLQKEPPATYAGVASPAFTEAPVTSLVAIDFPLELFSVDIYTTDAQRLVTVIEILSPVNKRRGHEAREEYLRKRSHLLSANIHFMEIDLLRNGDRSPLQRPVPPAHYYVTLCRADQRPRADVWPIQLGESLPVVPVPLLHPDPDVPLDLGAAVASVYERGAYGAGIDYTQPAPPPLDGHDAEWMDEYLRRQGIR